MHARKGNGKLVREIGVFDLLVMPLVICRGAAWCFGRCFATKQQNTHPDVLMSRLDNTEETLRPDFVDGMVDWILSSGVDVMSPHHAGDFWGQRYVESWAEIARRLPCSFGLMSERSANWLKVRSSLLLCCVDG
jgi:hypothetical protein